MVRSRITPTSEYTPSPSITVAMWPSFTSETSTPIRNTWIMPHGFTDSMSRNMKPNARGTRPSLSEASR